MLCLKKIYRNDLLQLALILSFLRLDLSIYFNTDPRILRAFNSTNATNNLPATIVPELNPKNLDNVLLNYERQLFEDLNSLGRYNPVGSIAQNFNISAYLLNVDRHGIADTLLDNPGVAADSGVDESPSDVDADLPDNAAAVTIPAENQTTTTTEELFRTNSSFEDLPDDFLYESSPFPNEPPRELFGGIDQELRDDAPNILDDVDSLEGVMYSFADDSDFLFGNTLEDLQTLHDHRHLMVDYDTPEEHLQQVTIKTESHQEEATTSYASLDINIDNIKLEQPEEGADASGIDNSLFDADDETSIIVGELTQEDMDLIEVLWKQDVDLGFSLEAEDVKVDAHVADPKLQAAKVFAPNNSGSLLVTDYEEKLKAIEALNDGSLKVEKSQDDDADDLSGDDPWAGLPYTIDTETGEYVLKSGLGSALPVGPCENTLPLPLEDLDGLPLSLPDLLFDETFQLNGLDEENSQNLYDSEQREESPLLDVLGSSDTASVASGTTLKDITSEEHDILNMLQTAQFHSAHPHAFQSHMPYVRMNEQRWQDVTGMLGDGGASSGVLPGGSHHAHAAAFSAHAAHHAVAALQHLGHPHMHGHHAHVGAYAPDTRGVLTHNVTLTPPMSEAAHGISPFANLSGTNLGSAVATSINLTSTADSMGDSGASTSYKMENSPHDIMYFPNSSSEIGNATDGFLNSILNDEDLQLMDMAMNEGMYPMRMLDAGAGIGNGTMTNSTRMDVAAAAERMDASSDSAVSSMGSERVASLSDNEWGDATSDSGHTADHYALDYASKYRPYDYSYSSRQHSNGLLGSDNRRMSSVAQKKHHMFGKRFFQDQAANPPSSVKYEYNGVPSVDLRAIQGGQSMAGSARPKAPDVKFSCTMEHAGILHPGRSPLDHVHHNHTYNLPSESTGTMQRPVFRDKNKCIKNEEEPHLTRDEKRARALNVPMSVDDIINLPMDEFNERLSKFDLSEPQLSLIRDIRRRGKNKVAAQNCRKRKLDQILSLADEVKDMRDRKHRLLTERDFMVNERQRVKEKFTQLYRHVFRYLRDPDGNLYSPNLYSLQQSADGTVLVVPKTNVTDHKDHHKKPQQ